MKNTQSKKSIVDFKRNAVISSDQLLKIKGGSTDVVETIVDPVVSLIIIEDPVT